jgi:hypothetical protein
MFASPEPDDVWRLLAARNIGRERFEPFHLLSGAGYVVIPASSTW